MGMKIAIIGTGKMGTAIACGLIEQGIVSPGDLRGADISADARRAFADASGAAVCASPREAVVGADTILLSVRPQDAQGVVDQLAGRCREQLILSIAAGIRIASLMDWFENRRVVRIMPNTPMIIARGMAAFSCAEGVSDADRDVVYAIFGAVATVREVPEEQMDTVTALSGSGPAYVFEFIQAMVEGAADLGMAPQIALDLAAQTVAGAAEMVTAKCGSPEELRAAVASKGGTTAEGLKVLDQSGIRDLMRRVLRAAHDRSVELGKG